MSLPTPTTIPQAHALPAQTPLRLSAMGLIAPLFGGTALTAVVLAIVNALAAQPEWWRGLAAAGASTFVSLLLSLAIVLPLLNRSATTLAGGFLVAGIVRTAVLGALIVLAIKLGGYPQNATLAFAGVFYFAIVGIEGTVLWSASQPKSDCSTQPTRGRA